jgi:hypothetical protein
MGAIKLFRESPPLSTAHGSVERCNTADALVTTSDITVEPEAGKEPTVRVY